MFRNDAVPVFRCSGVPGFTNSHLYSGEAYIWNEVSIIFRGLQYTVEKSLYFLVIDTHFCVHIEQFIRWVLMSIQWEFDIAAITIA